jgi:flagellar protein FlbT
VALVIDLKPQEKILIGEAVITNSSQRTRLHIAGDAPILREKDIMQEDEADTPCKKVYFMIQCMYIAHDAKQ